MESNSANKTDASQPDQPTEKEGEKEDHSRIVKLPDSAATMEGTHCYMVIQSKFEVEKRYEIINPLGQGAYGVIAAAIDQTKKNE